MILCVVKPISYNTFLIAFKIIEKKLIFSANNNILFSGALAEYEPFLCAVRDRGGGLSFNNDFSASFLSPQIFPPLICDQEFKTRYKKL